MMMEDLPFRLLSALALRVTRSLMSIGDGEEGIMVIVSSGCVLESTKVK